MFHVRCIQRVSPAALATSVVLRSVPPCSFPVSLQSLLQTMWTPRLPRRHLRRHCDDNHSIAGHKVRLARVVRPWGLPAQPCAKTCGV